MVGTWQSCYDGNPKNRLRMKLNSLFLALLFFPLICFSQGISIHGIVYEKRTHKPISGAEITTLGNQRRNVSVTDDNGFYKLDLLPHVKPGQQITLLVKKAGYRPANKNIGVSSEVQFPVELEKDMGAMLPRGKLKIDTLFNLVGKDVKTIAFEMIVSNPTTQDVQINGASLFNKYEIRKASFSPFFYKANYEIRFDSISSEVINDTSTHRQFKINVFEGTDSLGYRSSGTSTYINSNKILSVSADVRFPLFLMLPKNSRMKIRIVFSSPRKKLTDEEESGFRSATGTMSSLSKSFKVILSLDGDKKLTYNSEDIFLIESIFK
jgi:hypothetical protein